MDTSNGRCERCGQPLTMSWVSVDGKNYHGNCLPMRTLSAVDPDTIANIDRLTAQVQRQQERIAELERLRSDDQIYINTIRADRNEARAQVQRLQEQLTAVEQVRDSFIDKHSAVFGELCEAHDRVRELEADNAAMRELMLRRVEEADAANERVRVLEGAPRKSHAYIEAVVERHLPSTKPVLIEWGKHMMATIDTALTSTPPAAIDPDELSAAVLRAGGRVTYEDGTVVTAPPAETPAPTCKWCSRLPGVGTAICDDCRDSRTVAKALLGKKARDASADALSRCGRCDGYDPCLRCSDLGQIDRLEAELVEQIAAKHSAENLLAARSAICATHGEPMGVACPACLGEERDRRRAAQAHLGDDFRRHLAAADAEIDRLKTEFAAANERADGAWREHKAMRDLLQVTKDDLAAANEENARLREAVYGPVNMERDETLEVRAKRNIDELRHAHAATTAKLGRAVAFLERAAKVLPEHMGDDLDAILADADSNAAGEAWAEMVAVYEAAKPYARTQHEETYEEWSALQRAVNAVDARRGQGGGR